jgi:hypothetical protein
MHPTKENGAAIEARQLGNLAVANDEAASKHEHNNSASKAISKADHNDDRVVVSANSIWDIKFVRQASDIEQDDTSFHPEFTHVFFEDDEEVEGYGMQCDTPHHTRTAILCASLIHNTACTCRIHIDQDVLYGSGMLRVCGDRQQSGRRLPHGARGREGRGTQEEEPYPAHRPPGQAAGVVARRYRCAAHSVGISAVSIHRQHRCVHCCMLLACWPPPSALLRCVATCAADDYRYNHRDWNKSEHGSLLESKCLRVRVRIKV